MIHPTAKVSGKVNKKLPAGKTMVQLLALHNDPERHNNNNNNTTMHSVTNG